MQSNVRRPIQRLHCRGGVLLRIAYLLLAFLAAPALAQNCTTPVNLDSNGSFDGGLTGYSTTGSWMHNQGLDAATYGTIYNSRAAVENATAAPTGQDAVAYPAASLTAFAINENDAANDTLTIASPAGAHMTYFANQLYIWFDMGWRQAGGTPTTAATLALKVNGTTYFTVTTVAGNSIGKATGALSNGATYGSSTPNSYVNDGGAGSLSRWYTLRIIVPYTASAVPQISFSMSGGGGISDDFALDRIYVPLCPVTAISVTKSSTVLSDPVNGSTNPKMIPGAQVRYCIIVTNPASNPTATSIALSDPLGALPATYVAGSLRINGSATGGTCNADGNVGGSVSAGTVSATLSDIPAGGTRTTYFDVTVN
jgi:hypothetical protein